MTRVLKSYLSGSWSAGEGDGATLYNPTTEEAVAQTSTKGLDLAGALDFARNSGGGALRAMTFAQRGEMLKNMAKTLHEYREEFIDLALLNGGNTRSDAKFDIDGGSFTLGYYAKIGSRLGDRKLLLDGRQERLGVNPRFIGQHFSAPRHGVAVHINAFNFPAWGFAEKAAVALLAGMPVLCKPATSTSLLTERMFHVLTESGCVPAGAISLLCGSAGDLLDHLNFQDVLAFTGSSDTARMLRTHENLLNSNVRINVEADSLNAAVLGPDVDSDDETFDLFLAEVRKDMTQKAGQKCTAIRRVFVPEAILDDVKGALSAELEAVVVGDPGQKGVKMGPVATANQLRDVTAGIERLKSETQTVFGNGGRGTLVGIDHDRGYFVEPTLLCAPSIDTAIVHADEVFGPVATLIPYSGAASEAVRGVLRGEGGLVSSVYSDDKKFVEEMLLGIAPGHGRIHLGSKKIADASPGPGTAQPSLIHGGPGRAGGGEELGSTRSMAFYMQRTAVQGSKPVLERILGVDES